MLQITEQDCFMVILDFDFWWFLHQYESALKYFVICQVFNLLNKPEQKFAMLPYILIFWFTITYTVSHIAIAYPQVVCIKNWVYRMCFWVWLCMWVMAVALLLIFLSHKVIRLICRPTTISLNVETPVKILKFCHEATVWKHLYKIKIWARLAEVYFQLLHDMWS